MILADTSVWIDHLRNGDSVLESLLDQNEVLMHPMVVGELACGNLRDREEYLGFLASLPQMPPASHREVLSFIERNQLMGQGIGYIDAHLLAAASLAESVLLWSKDRRLLRLAERMGLAARFQ